MSNQVKKVRIESISVSTQNPRFEIVANQREAIIKMVEKQGEKLINLAEDILENGLNPSELIILSPNNQKGYNVLEGNRRISAIKILSNPEIINANGIEKAIYNKFKALSKKYLLSPLKSLDCLVCENEEDANKWIDLKHTGENEGIGTVRWDSQQKDRFLERISGKSSISLQVIDFARNSKDIDEKLKQKLSSISITNLERLINDSAIQEVIGIEMKGGKLQTILPPEEVAKGFNKVLGDLAHKRIKVKDIYYKKDREKYIESFDKADLPNKKTQLSSPWELNSTNQPTNTTPTGPKPAAKKKAIPISTTRRFIIPKGFIIRITEPKINKIYQELKGLDVDEFENAGAILLRVFLELSLDTFIGAKRITKVNKSSELRLKLEAVANYMESNSIMDKHELKPIRTSVSNAHSVLSINTFNAYVHNKSFSPVAKDIKVTWDNIQYFVEKLWE